MELLCLSQTTAVSPRFCVWMLAANFLHALTVSRHRTLQRVGAHGPNRCIKWHEAAGSIPHLFFKHMIYK